MKKIKLYPGKLEISANYRENNILGRNLAYLSLANSDFTGRVENFVLKDEDNLSYRDDLSKKISVFVPNSYDGTTPHDILYFFDAQNLFANAGHYTDNASLQYHEGGLPLEPSVGDRYLLQPFLEKDRCYRL